MTESHDDPAADQIGAALSRLLAPLTETPVEAAPVVTEELPVRHLPAVVDTLPTHQIGPARVRTTPPPPPPPWAHPSDVAVAPDDAPPPPQFVSAPPPPPAPPFDAEAFEEDWPIAEPEPPAAPPQPPPPPPPPDLPVEPEADDEPPDTDPDDDPADPRRGRERVFVAVPPRDVDGDRHRSRGLRRAVATLLRQRRRLLLSTLIVALGVAYLAGSLSLLGRVSNGLDDLAGIGTERADFVVEGDIAIDTPFEQTRRLVPDGLVPQLQLIDGVRAAEGRVEDSTVILDESGTPIVPLGLTEQPLAANWPEVAELNPYRFVGNGRGPTGPGEVVIDEASAIRGNIGVGDQVFVTTKSDLRSLTVVGVVNRAGRELPTGSSLALFDTASARELFDRATDDNSIGIVLDKGADRAKVEKELRAVVPFGTVLVDRDTYEHDRSIGLSKSFELIRILLLGFAGLAVLVGSFTVANSNALLFARRRQSFALLRLVGASPSQLRGAAAVEAILVGLAAVVVGIPLGLLVGRFIESTLGALGTAIPAAGSPVSATMIIVSAVVGLSVTLLTALLPARDAARSSPMVALTRSDDGPETHVPPLARLLLLVVGGAVLGAALGFAATKSGSGAGIGAAVGAGMFLVGWAIPRVLGRLVTGTTKVLIGPSPSMRSLTALRSRRARSRAASTTAALLLATAVVAGLSTLSASFVASLGDQVGKIVTADLVVDSGTFTRGGLSNKLVTDLADIPGVTAVSGLRVGAARIGGQAIRLAAVNGRQATHLLELGIADPPDQLLPTEMFISEQLATTLGVDVGSTVDLEFDNAIQQMRIAGIYTVKSPLLGDAIIDTNLLAEVTPASIDIVALVDIDPSQPAVTTAAVEQLADSYGIDNVSRPGELVDRRFELVRGFERVIQWMLLFSVALAVVGIANTLQLSVNERKRELGLLRAVGGGRRQVVRLVLVEAAALSIVGAVVGSLLGLGGAFLVVRLLADLGLGVFQVPVLVLAATGVAALVLGVLGAWLPAVAASRTGIMEALGEDDDTGGTGVFGFFGRYRDARRSRRLVADSRVRPTGARYGTAAQGDTEGPEEPPRGTEDDMARCYNCGNDPGSDERCQVCGASLQPEPAGMFSTAPGAAAATAAAAGRTGSGSDRPTTGLWSTGTNGTNGNGNGSGHEDIVDAAVIEDDEAATGTPLGSIFDDVPDPVTSQDVTFNRPPPAAEPPPAANDEPPWVAPPPPPPPSEPPPHAPYAMPAAGQYYPGAPMPGYGQQQPYPQQTYPQPQQPVSDPGRGESFGTPPSMLPVHVPSSDSHALSAAVSRMSMDSQRTAAPALLVAGVLLGPEERVIGVVQGWALGMPSVAILSTSRVLIVSERRWKPIIETFPLRPALTVYGRHVDQRATMTFQDGDHVVTIDQIPDVTLAVEMATAARTQSTANQGF